MSQGPNLDDLLPNFSEDDIMLMSDDLAQLASMAARGDALPLAGGTISAWWGVILGVTNLYQCAAYLGQVPGPIPIGLIQIIVGWGGTYALMIAEKKTNILQGWRSQAIATIWLFSGASIMIFFVGSILSGHTDFAATNIFLSLIFALNFAAMATSRSGGWLRLAAAGWTVAAFATFFLKGNNAVMSLVFGLSAFAFMFAPGLVLRWQEKRSLA